MPQRTPIARFASKSLKHHRFSHITASTLGEAYRLLQTELAATQTRLETTLSGDALAGFERQIRTAEERRCFWASLCTVPEIDLDTTAIAGAWQAVRNGLSAAPKAKRADPLTVVVINEETQRAVATYATAFAVVAEQSRLLLAANENIQRVKEATQAGNVQATEREVKRLKGTKARHTPATAALCTAYLTEKTAKEQAGVTKRPPNKPWIRTESPYFLRIKRRSTHIWSGSMPAFLSNRFSPKTHQAARVAPTTWFSTRTVCPW